MKIYIQILLAIFLLFGVIEYGIAAVSSKSFLWIHDSSTVSEEVAEPGPGGFWKTRTEWKAYWVKEWVTKKIYVPLWKHVWGPTQIREWVPTGIAKPPPVAGWKRQTIIRSS